MINNRDAILYLSGAIMEGNLSRQESIDLVDWYSRDYTFTDVEKAYLAGLITGVNHD